MLRCRKTSYVEEKPSKASYCVSNPIYSDLCQWASKLVVIISIFIVSLMIVVFIFFPFVAPDQMFAHNTVHKLFKIGMIVNMFCEKMIENTIFKWFSEINYLYSISLTIPQRQGRAFQGHGYTFQKSINFSISPFIPVVPRKCFSYIPKILLELHPLCFYL